MAGSPIVATHSQSHKRARRRKHPALLRMHSRNNALLNQIRDSVGEPDFAKAHLSHPTEQVATHRV